MDAVEQCNEPDEVPADGLRPSQVIAVLNRRFVSDANARHTVEPVLKVSLATCAWNEFRPVHLSRVDLLGYLIWPVFLLVIVLRPELLVLVPIALVGGSLLILRAQQRAFFTETHLHAPRGWFGFSDVVVPIGDIEDIVLEPVKAMPGMATINVRYGMSHLEFPCVPDAERKALVLRRAVDRAGQQSPK